MNAASFTMLVRVIKRVIINKLYILKDKTSLNLRGPFRMAPPGRYRTSRVPKCAHLVSTRAWYLKGRNPKRSQYPMPKSQLRTPAPCAPYTPSTPKTCRVVVSFLSFVCNISTTQNFRQARLVLLACSCLVS
jgi:hypothetical protein